MRKKRPTKEPLTDRLGFDPADDYRELRDMLNDRIREAESRVALASNNGRPTERISAWEELMQLKSLRQQLSRELMPYCHGKMSAVDVNASVDSDFTVNVVRFGIDHDPE